MELDNNLLVFFTLVRAGLWADLEYTDILDQGLTEPVDWDKIYQLAEEQSVLGVVLAGLEHSYGKQSFRSSHEILESA